MGTKMFTMPLLIIRQLETNSWPTVDLYRHHTAREENYQDTSLSRKNIRYKTRCFQFKSSDRPEEASVLNTQS